VNRRPRPPPAGVTEWMVMKDVALDDQAERAEEQAKAAEHMKWDPACKVEDAELTAVDAAIRAVACGNDVVVTCSSRPAVKVWKVAEAKLVESQSLRYGAVGSSCVEVAGDSHTVAACGDDGAIGLWDLRANKRTGELGASISIAWKAKFLPNGRQLVSGGPSGALNVWDLRMNRLETEIAADGLAPKGEDRDATKRRRKDPRAADRPEGAVDGKKPGPIYSLAASGDGRLLGCGRGSGEISVMRLEGHEWVGNVSAHMGGQAAPVRALVFDSASRLLLSGGDDNHVCLVDAASWARQRPEGVARSPHMERFSAHRMWVTSVSTCPDPSRRVVVTTSWDATVKLWDYCTHTLLCSYKEHADSVFASAFAPVHGRFFVTAGVDAAVALYVAKHDLGAAPTDATNEAMLVPVAGGM